MFLQTLYNDYRLWLTLNTSFPRNILGYLLQWCLSPFRCEPYDIACYDDPAEIEKLGVHGTKSFLKGGLPEREGARPTVPKWMVPHRQISQLGEGVMHEKIFNHFLSLLHQHPKHLILTTSPLEAHGDALVFSDTIPSPHWINSKVRREIAHIHKPDYSLHLTLSPRDCKEVLGKGWGERFTLSGAWLPREFVLVYTPRDEGELEVLGRVLKAAVGFGCGLEEGEVGDE